MPDRSLLWAVTAGVLCFVAGVVIGSLSDTGFWEIKFVDELPVCNSLIIAVSRAAPCSQ